LNDYGELYSAEINLVFNPEYLTFQNLKLNEQLSGLIYEYTLNRGELHIAIASANSIANCGNDLMKLKFKELNDIKKLRIGIHIKSALVNEIAINTQPGKQKLDETPEIPVKFALSQSYPNPFNPVTTISYTIAKNSHVRLAVYNTLGQVVTVLVNGYQAQGSYNVMWNAEGQPSGFYVYQLEADGFTASKKMFLQK